MENFKEIFAYGISKGCDLVEIYNTKSKSMSFQIENNEVSALLEKESNGLGIRVKMGKKIGFSHCTSSASADVIESLDVAISLCKYMEDDPFTSFVEGIKSSDSIKDDLREKIINQSFEAKVSYLKEQLKIIESKELKSEIDSCEYEEEVYETHILNSQSLDIYERGAYCGAAISLKIEDQANNVNESGYDYFYSRDIDLLFNRDLGNRAYNNCTEMMGAKSLKTGTYKGILHRDIVVSILGLLSGSFNGESVLKKKSMFRKEHLGTTMFSPLISIVDDGTLVDLLGYGKYDCEGTLVKKNTLVNQGILNMFLYDLKTGNEENVPSTGNGSRSYGSTSGIGPHNLYLENGDTDYDDLILEVENGIIIKDVMGLHMANGITGDFSLGASGFIIKDGKVSGSFRGVTFSGNIKKILNDVIKVGSDLEFKISKGAPSLMIGNLQMSGE